MTKILINYIISLEHAKNCMQKKEKKMILGKNEEELKSWVYGTSQVKNVTSEHRLTVTNKRIIAESNSARKIERQEIGISSVKSISLTHEIGSKALAIFLMFLGVVLFGAAIFMMVSDGDSMGLAVGLGLLLFAVIFFVSGIMHLHQGKFVAIIATKEVEGDKLSLGASSLRTKKLKGGKMKVAVDNDVAAEIVETLGALLLAN